MDDEHGRCFFCERPLHERHAHEHGGPGRPVCCCTGCAPASVSAWVTALLRVSATETLTAWDAERERVQ
jgi:hypothetical protein